MNDGIIGKKVSILVPHRISGLFQIIESGEGRPIDDISKIGSRGGGPSLSAFGKTTVKIVDELKNDEPSMCKIYMNGKDCTASAKTSNYVFSHITSSLKKHLKIEIIHKFDLDIGAGYGASGCGAIGTALGLNYLLDLGLSYNKAGKIAHIAEVKNKTGLGTVGGQLAGGLSLTIKPGYPFCLDKILVPPNTKIICGSFGPIPTKTIIGDSKHKEKIKSAGAWAMAELMKYPLFQNFIDKSKKFVDKSGLLELPCMEETKDLINDLDKIKENKKDYGASMNQLGKSVFCFCSTKDEPEVIEVYETYKPKINFIKSLEVCEHGPILKKD